MGGGTLSQHNKREKFPTILGESCDSVTLVRGSRIHGAMEFYDASLST